MKTTNPATGEKIDVRIAVTDAKTAHFSAGNSKMGKIISYSTMPGAGLQIMKDGRAQSNIGGTCAGVCAGCEKVCYAMKSLRYPETVRAWSENTKMIETEPSLFFDQLRAKLRRMRKLPAAVRVHVAGEFMPGEAGEREYLHLCAAAREFPTVKFYGYTKRTAILEKFADLTPANVIISVSTWHDDVAPVPGFPIFAYDDGTDPALDRAVHCPAVDKSGKRTGVTCDQCRRCIDAEPDQITAVYAH